MAAEFTYLVAWQIDGEAYAIFREGTVEGSYRLDCLKPGGWTPVKDDPLSQFLHRGAWEIELDEAREIAASYELPFGDVSAAAAASGGAASAASGGTALGIGALAGAGSVWRPEDDDDDAGIALVPRSRLDVVDDGDHAD